MVQIGVTHLISWWGFRVNRQVGSDDLAVSQFSSNLGENLVSHPAVQHLPSYFEYKTEKFTVFSIDIDWLTFPYCCHVTTNEQTCRHEQVSSCQLEVTDCLLNVSRYIKFLKGLIFYLLFIYSDIGESCSLRVNSGTGNIK